MQKVIYGLIGLVVLACLLGAYQKVTLKADEGHLQDLLDYSVLVKNSQGGQGTGVIFVNGDKVFCWTAAHCVTDCGRNVERTVNGETKKFWEWDEVQLIRVRNYNGRKTGFVTFFAKVIRYSEVEDVALLQVYEDASFFKSATFAPVNYSPRLNTQVWHSGGFWGIPGAGSFSSGYICNLGRLRAPLGHEEWRGPKIMDQVNIIAAPGSSGGGVIEKDTGHVIGLLTETINSIAGAYLILPTRRLWDYAERANCLFAMDKTQSVPEGFDVELTEYFK